jgi:hypothetical protein
MSDHSVERAPKNIEDLLRPSEQALWHDYWRYLAQGLRRRALQAMETLDVRLQAYPTEVRQAWVRAWCRTHLDEDEDVDLRRPYPLLAHLIIPELRRGYEAGEPSYARWLARLYRSSIVHPRKLTELLARPNLTSKNLLREALRADPTDRHATQWLITELAGAFDYYTHEVPSGVLANPSSFREELDEFEGLAARLGLTDRYAAKLRLWRFHCERWAYYLQHRSEFVNYADYLSRAAPTEDGH